jgi:PAS domain S-box-containing protein
MNPESIPIWLALVAQAGLGLAVFRANHRSYSNQSFLALSSLLSAWLLCLHFAYNARGEKEAELWIRNASACGVLIVNGFYLLRFAITSREGGWREIGRRLLPIAACSMPALALCYSSLFLRYVTIPTDVAHVVPQPVYGALFPVHTAFVILAALIGIVGYFKDLRHSAGMQKIELQFVAVGGATLVLLVLVGLALQPVLPRPVVVLVAPFRVVIFSLIIAYGIATRKIMDVGLLFRRTMSYVVLTAYLLVLYAVVWWLVSRVFAPFGRIETRTLAHISAALAVAFAMAPARGVSQALANRLFVGTRGLDFRSTVSKAASILRSVTTLPDLLERFAKTIGEAVGTDRVVILLPTRHGLAQAYPPPTNALVPQTIEIANGNPVLRWLEAQPEPLVLDELHRVRPTPELDAVMEEMHRLRAAVAMPIFAREHLAGLLLLGPRFSGSIYGSVEQSALQVLAGQLAVAIENAQLFTEVQNARIYNETLLQNLTTGVVAADCDGRISVFNKEAEQITEIGSKDLLDRPISELPHALCEVLRDSLDSGELQQNREIVLRSDEKSVVVRASSSIFHGQNGEMLGAMMVLTDITALKRLESQIRRSDRLASLGTLSAGMAHEIKNPLVSIKTFAQLLPERYQDSDFRDTFSNLIGHEIDRIDSLVNQLLRFARPAKPHLKPMHVHDVLEKSLMLVGHRLYQKEIKLSRSWNAEVDTIRADADQLEQVFLNFFLNAMDAMKQGGELAVTTEIRAAEELVPMRHANRGSSHEVLRITVRDNGDGIRNEDIGHVFDPFFTTKDYGTGLGLSVVHGIVQEHGGQIEVESELEKGTAFHILLPLVRFESEVAAA